jgi:pyrroline-5-carboxylate reductase
LYGTAELLQQNNEDFKALIKRVATKGGATEAGVSILEAQLPEIFENVFIATLGRHEARKEMTRQQFMKK